MSTLFAATYPERTAALVLLGCFPRRLWAPDYPWVVTREERAEYWRRLEAGWGSVAWAQEDLGRRAPSASTDERFQRWWATYLRMSASPGAALAMSRMNAEIDVRHVLPAIRVPTLIIHQVGDRLAPVEGARYMAERIPGARYLELPGDDHLPFVGDQDVILAKIERFVTGAQVPPEPDTVLLTLLVVTVSDFLNEPVGAEAGAERRKRDDLQNAVRQELARFRGREIEATDERLLATFDGPARAIRCASAIAIAARSAGFVVRAGLHTGECELIDGRIRGLALRIAESVATRAGSGEVLVSGTVKDLVAGSGIEFEDLGLHPLVNTLEEWRLFRVAESQAGPQPGAIRASGPEGA
jgi:class 3 adenylate cyclase